MPPLHLHKKLIVCCDGTWNRPEKEWNQDEKNGDDKRYRATNVVKISRLLQPCDGEGRHQVIYYDPGVGTDRSLFDRYVGGLTGLGLSAHLKKAYRFLCHNYVDGDELYFFGFSRGAYTVRALGGMLGCVGLLLPEHLHLLPAAFHYYNTHPLKRGAHPFRKITEDHSKTRRALIKMIGVWDTVGALGVPIPYIKPLTRKWVGFFDTELGGHVEYAYHAVAIDERRGPFKPDLWTKSAESKTKTSHTKDICQVWFPGSHSDIGGGALDTKLSDEALLWMVHRAQNVGLDFKDSEIQKIQANVDRQKSHPENSFRWIYKGLMALGVLPHTRVIGGEGPAFNKMALKIPRTSQIWKQRMKQQSSDAEVLKADTSKKAGRTRNEMIHESGFQKFLHEGENQQYTRYTPKNLSQELIHRLPVFREDYYQKRRSVRLPLHVRGILELNENRVDCDVMDFSVGGGVRLHCDQPLQLKGQNVILKLQEGEYQGTYDSRVVWEQKFGLGLKFHEKTASGIKA